MSGVGIDMHMLCPARSEHNALELDLLFHLYVGSGDRTRVMRLHSKPLDLLSHSLPLSLLNAGGEVMKLAHSDSFDPHVGQWCCP